MRCLLLLFTLALSGALYFQAAALEDLAVAIERLDAEIMEPYVTTWVDADNMTHSVTTVKKDTETEAEAAARHKTRVDALKALFPPA